jgi:hypothetical protein
MRRGKMQFPDASAKYPWVVERHGQYETELRELIAQERPEINLAPIFDSAENLLSHMPNPEDYNETYSTNSSREEIVRDNANLQIVGLLYGKVQSGKTISSICLTALAADNGYRNVIVLTSNVELLHAQTMMDYKESLVTARVLGEPKTKTIPELKDTVSRLQDNEVVILTGKKNPTSLKSIEKIISTKRGILPTLIIDDEGDQASLNIGRDDKNSEIYQSISNIRSSIGLHCYVTVTATPFANLQLDPKKEKELYPEVIQSLVPGEGYTGADVFFNTHLKQIWREIPIQEKEELSFYSNQRSISEIPLGFKRAVIYHLLTCRVRKSIGLHGEHSMLINVQKDKKNHKLLKEKLENILNYLSDACKIGSDKWNEIEGFAIEAYDDILDQEIYILDQEIDIRSELYKSLSEDNLSIQIINADNPDPPQYGGDYRSTFLIGQTKLGRGLRIRGLVTTYFLYTPNIANMDSYSQACRFFGYRKRILPLMRIFSPSITIKRWQHIRVMEKYTYGYLDSLSSTSGSFKGLISLERPLMLLQKKLNSSRKIKGQIESELQSPIDDVLWYMSEIPPQRNEEVENIVDELITSTPLDITLASKILGIFDRPETIDYNWPIDFLVNVLKNIHSEYPYKARSLNVIQSDKTLTLDGDFSIPEVDAEEYSKILHSSEDRSVVILLRRAIFDENEFFLPCIYLPRLDHGFHVR